MSRRKKYYSIVIPRFITHVATSKKKFTKIGGQKIYSGINFFIRAKIMGELHSYISKYIPKDLSLKTPIKIELEIHCPINFGDVRMGKDKVVTYKSPPKDYIPRWDVDNLWLWGKAFQDVLTELKAIPDDNVKYVKKSGSIEFIEQPDWNRRKLVFKIYEG